jgi:glycerol-1-phosphate dehydrogenase [NAD(P)+]
MAKLHGLDWKGIRDSLETIGAPTTAKELGIPREIVIEGLTSARAVRPNRYTILNKIHLTPEKAEILAEDTGVI